MTTDIIKVSVFVDKHYARNYLREGKSPGYIVVDLEDVHIYARDDEYMCVASDLTLQVQRPTLAELGAE